jgi:hypothetical protein
MCPVMQPADNSDSPELHISAYGLISYTQAKMTKSCKLHQQWLPAHAAKAHITLWFLFWLIKEQLC